MACIAHTLSPPSFCAQRARPGHWSGHRTGHGSTAASHWNDSNYRQFATKLLHLAHCSCTVVVSIPPFRRRFTHSASAAAVCHCWQWPLGAIIARRHRTDNHSRRRTGIAEECRKERSNESITIVRRWHDNGHESEMPSRIAMTVTAPVTRLT